MSMQDILKARGASHSVPSERKKQGMRAAAFYAPDGNVEQNPVDKQTIARAYTGNTWVYQSIQKIAMDIAGLKIRIFDKSTGKKIEVTDDPRFRVLNGRPNIFNSSFDLWEATISYLELHGEAFWELVRDEQGQVVRLFAINPIAIEPIPDDKFFIRGYKLRDSNGRDVGFLRPDQVMYIKYFNPLTDVRGLGSIEPIQCELVLNIHSLTWAKAFFENRGVPEGVLQTNEDLTDEDYKKLRDNWQEARSGLANQRKTAILPEGVEYKEIGLGPNDIQFLDQLNFTRSAILSGIGQPPAVAGIFDDAIKANAAEQDISYWTHTIIPKTNKAKSFLEQIFVPMLAHGPDITKIFDAQFEVEFDFSAVPFIQKQRAEFIEKVGVKMFDRAAMTPNELRFLAKDVFPMLGLGPLIANGDLTFAFQNLRQQGFASVDDIFIRKQDGIDDLIDEAFNTDTDRVNDFLFVSGLDRLDIDDRTRTALIAVFQQGVQDGLNLEQIAANVASTFDEFSAERALTIARTEAIGNLNFASLEAAFQSGVVVDKSWLTQRDAVVRGNDPNDSANHVILDGERKALQLPFSNGLMFPGDQRPGKAEEVVRCRCAMNFLTAKSSRLKEDAQAQLKDMIWKQFDATAEAFESQMEEAMKELFNVQKRALLKEMKRLDTLGLAEFESVMSEVLLPGQTSLALNKITRAAIALHGQITLNQINALG